MINKCLKLKKIRLSFFSGILFCNLILSCNLNGGFIKSAQIVGPILPAPPGGEAATDFAVAIDFGVFDSNCFLNSRYDACLFWKNPVAQYQLPDMLLNRQNISVTNQLNVSSGLKFRDDLSSKQIFGVRLDKQINSQQLTSSSIQVFSSDSPAIRPPWKISYKDDANTHKTASVMTYFWLTEFEKRMLARSNIFYAKDKNISVDSYISYKYNQSFWDGARIILGQRLDTSIGVEHEMALSSEISIHEYGHANLHFSGGSDLGSSLCPDQYGCISAINEGQADFHYLLMFPERSAFGETASNDSQGWFLNGVTRDVRKLTNWKIEDFYNQSTPHGEPHAMGSAYTSILWEIYTNPDVNKIDFEKIFMIHLSMLTDSTNFLGAKEILLSIDKVHFSGRYQNAILKGFQQKGL